jgi:hypothetical protein
MLFLAPERTRKFPKISIASRIGPYSEFDDMKGIVSILAAI